MHYGGAISSHGLLLDDVDELKGAAKGGVWIWPLGALEMSHLQDIVILTQGETHRNRRRQYSIKGQRKEDRPHVRGQGSGQFTCVASRMKSWMMICSSLERHSLSLLMRVTVKAMQFMASSRLGQYTNSSSA